MGKNQHYVPQLLLRNFAIDNNAKGINLFHIKTGRIIQCASIANQASKDNIYGADQEIENYFCMIETNASIAFRKLLNGDYEISLEELSAIFLFLNYQLCRTPTAVNNAIDLIATTIEEAAGDDDFARNKMQSDSGKIENYYKFMFDIACQTAFSIADLRLGILHNYTSTPFILSQHPVIVFNPFLESRRWPGGRSGTANKGTVLYMPLNSETAIVLYDGLRYKLSNFKNEINISVDDVNNLNTGEFASTDECVYFGSKYDSIPLKNYVDDTVVYRNGPKTSVKTFRQLNRRRNRNLSELLISSQTELPIRQNFDFLGIKLSALSEDLGETMDITRESIKKYIPRDYPVRYKIR